MSVLHFAIEQSMRRVQLLHASRVAYLLLGNRLHVANETWHSIRPRMGLQNALARLLAMLWAQVPVS